MRKQNIYLADKQKCQEKLKKLILDAIKKNGLFQVETYHLPYLKGNYKTMLPTALNHRETVRMWELVIADYKRSNTIN